MSKWNMTMHSSYFSTLDDPALQPINLVHCNCELETRLADLRQLTSGHEKPWRRVGEPEAPALSSEISGTSERTKEKVYSAICMLASVSSQIRAHTSASISHVPLPTSKCLKLPVHSLLYHFDPFVSHVTFLRKKKNAKKFGQIEKKLLPGFSKIGCDLWHTNWLKNWNGTVYGLEKMRRLSLLPPYLRMRILVQRFIVYTWTLTQNQRPVAVGCCRDGHGKCVNTRFFYCLPYLGPSALSFIKWGKRNAGNGSYSKPNRRQTDEGLWR